MRWDMSTSKGCWEYLRNCKDEIKRPGPHRLSAFQNKHYRVDKKVFLICLDGCGRILQHSLRRKGPSCSMPIHSSFWYAFSYKSFSFTMPFGIFGCLSFSCLSPFVCEKSQVRLQLKLETHYLSTENLQLKNFLWHCILRGNKASLQLYLLPVKYFQHQA